MISNLAYGTCLVAFTVMLHTAGLLLLARLTPFLAHRLGFHNHDLGRTLVMTGSVLGIFLLHTLEIWLWAWGYLRLDAALEFSQALDLSTAMFSTLGYGGGIAPLPARHLLTALEGINGFILIGWSTAYLVGVATRHGPFRAGDHF